MSMFTLAISCLTTSNLPWFMDLTLQVPMQRCSLQHQTLLPSPVILITLIWHPNYCFSFFLILDTQNVHLTERTNHLIFKQEKPRSLWDAELVQSWASSSGEVMMLSRSPCLGTKNISWAPLSVSSSPTFPPSASGDEGQKERQEVSQLPLIKLQKSFPYNQIISAPIILSH